MKAMYSQITPLLSSTKKWAYCLDHLLYFILILTAGVQLWGWLYYPGYKARAYGFSETKIFAFFIAACLWRCRYYLSQFRIKQSSLFSNEELGIDDAQFIRGYACGYRDAKWPQKSSTPESPTEV